MFSIFDELKMAMTIIKHEVLLKNNKIEQISGVL